MSTFGYESIGGNSDHIGDTIRGSEFSLPESASVSKITASVQAAVPVTIGARAAIYDTSGNLQGVTQERSYSGEEFAQRWDDYTFASDLVLSSGNYILTLWTDIDSVEGSGLLLHYDSGATDQGVSDSEAYDGNYPDPASFTQNNKEYSIYATYTAAPSVTLPSVTTHPVTNIQET